METKEVLCCHRGQAAIKWITASQADDDEDGFYLPIHCGYPDAVYEFVSFCPFCGAELEEN